MNAVTALVLAPLIGYVSGSLPFGLWLGRWLRGVDVRTLGSGNLGATNVYRSLGRGIGIATLILDMAKGALPVALVPAGAVGAAFPGGAAVCAIAVGLGAILGHVFTFLAGFRGGKGVATAAGVVLALAPLATLLCLAIFVVTVAVTRYISVGSIVGSAAFPVAVALLSPRGVREPVFAFGVVVAALLIWRHRENITRLRRGEERRFTLKAETRS
jgi:acyl phosphate:glycerol-3-phosphate acyltransferase